MEFLRTKRDRAGLLIGVLGVAILLALTPFISGLLGAAVLYVVCIRGYRQLSAVVPRGVAAAVTLLLAIIGIALPLTWLVGIVIDQAPNIIRGLQDSPLIDQLGTLRIGPYDVGAELAQAGETLLRWLSAQAFNFMGSAANASINLVIAFFGLYYMLHSGDQLWEHFRGYVPFSPKTAEALRLHFHSVTRATLLGTAVVAAAQGSIVGLGFLLTGLPNALFWGTVTAFVSILPVLGSGLVWMPATIVLIVQQRYPAAIIMVVMGWLLASNIDNLLRPLVYRRVSNIHPMITLVGAFAGIKYFGLPGLLLGPLAIAYFFELLRFYNEEYGVPENGVSPPAPPPEPAVAPAGIAQSR
jgi:predicted PurR-regulated permease PerM